MGEARGAVVAPSSFRALRRTSTPGLDESGRKVLRSCGAGRASEAEAGLAARDAGGFAALPEEAPVGLVITDGYGKIFEANAAIASLLRLERVALRGKRLLNYVVRDSRRAFCAALLRLREAGGAVDLSVVLRPRKGAPLVGVTVSAVAKHVGQAELGVRWFLRAVHADPSAAWSADRSP